MISAEDDEELDETVEEYATDTTWSWVKWSVNHLHVWKSSKSMNYVDYGEKGTRNNRVCLDTCLHESTSLCPVNKAKLKTEVCVIQYLSLVFIQA